MFIIQMYCIIIQGLVLIYLLILQFKQQTTIKQQQNPKNMSYSKSIQTKKAHKQNHTTIPTSAFTLKQTQTSFLKLLQQNLQDLTQELQMANQKNIQLNKIICIVTEQRNYYQQELEKVQGSKREMEQLLGKVRGQLETKSLLVSQLKKANRALGEQIHSLNQNLQETKFLFQAQEQQIDRIKKQKQLIQSQWNRVIKQVNLKMNMMQKQQQEQFKQNIQITANLPLKDKVKKALRKIDKQIMQHTQHENQHQQKISIKKIGNFGSWNNNTKPTSSFSTTGVQLYGEYEDSISL